MQESIQFVIAHLDLMSLVVRVLDVEHASAIRKPKRAIWNPRRR